MTVECCISKGVFLSGILRFFSEDVRETHLIVDKFQGAKISAGIKKRLRLVLRQWVSNDFERFHLEIS